MLHLVALLIALGQAPSPHALLPRLAPVVVAAPVDPVVAEATAALANGRAWHATRLLEPLLTDPRRRTPEVVLLAARAAAAWEGWAHAHQLLAGERWLDSLFDGAGRALLARAALERGLDSAAAEHAATAVRLARAPRERGARLVVLACALERRGRPDSASAAFTRAAPLLPELDDWLRLGAAALTADSATRARTYAALRTTVARDLIAATEARALERAGDTHAAIRQYRSLGADADVLRLRLASATGTARDTVRRDMVALVTSRPGTADARRVVQLLDSAFAPLSADEELIVARSARRSGPRPRAITAHARALGTGLGTSEDRFAYASLLADNGQYTEAAREFARITAPRTLAASAAYGRARALLRGGNGAAATPALREIVTRYRDEEAAANALYLLGDLATDAGRDADARGAFRELVALRPGSPLVPRARFRAALIAFVAGNARTAALELDTLWSRLPGSDEANAARYWSGRAWSAAGDRDRALERWRGMLARDPLSYYALTSARRLGEPPPVPVPARDTFPTNAAVDSAMRRARLLEELGLRSEAQLEYARLARDADQSPDRLLATAAAFREQGLASRAIALASKALAAGVPGDARLYRLIYPIAQESVLVADAAARGLDRALVAGIIRQESNFNPRALSPAGAMGLMQLVPNVGRSIAQALRYPVWDPALLYQPDVSVELGTVHLASLVKSYDELAHAIAAYNAGGSRVRRWREKRGVADPEIFIERIPFVETRDYVRLVLRNRELYRGLYGWSASRESR